LTMLDKYAIIYACLLGVNENIYDTHLLQS